MIIKSKKIILVDEVKSFLSQVNEQNLKEGINNTYEEHFDQFLNKNYKTLPLDKLKDFIEIVNKLPLITEEKFKIINNKPKNQIELSLLIENSEDKLSKEEMSTIFNYITKELKASVIIESVPDNQVKKKKRRNNKKIK